MRVMIALVVASIAWMSASAAQCAEKVSADEQTVIDALARAVPGDVIVVKPGFYRGGWTMKPGTAEKPITLKAERSGRVFVGDVETHVGFEAVPGTTYSYSKPATAAPPKMRELDTAKELRWMAMPMDVEEVVGSYCFDEVTKRLYVHPTDSAGVTHHTYATISTTNGITVADYAIVDGFVMSGFGGSAVWGNGPRGAIVENCKLYRNGSAISLGGAKQCIVRNNECWENSPDYSQAAQIYMQDGTDGSVIEGNFVHHGFAHTGIFVYGDNRNVTLRRNVVWGAQGMAIKGRDNSGDLAEYNVSDGFVAVHGMRWNTAASSNDSLGTPDYQSDLLLRGLKGDKPAQDPKYADPAWADVRLQSDSPMRGKARDGKDLGAFQYKGDVVFVKPEGDDEAAGTSIASAWKTLAHAAKMLKAGQTLYILPGNYAEPLVLRDLRAAAGETTIVRVHGKGLATVREVSIEGCAGLEVSHVAVRAAAGSGYRAAKSERIVLRNGASYQSRAAGVELYECRDVAVERFALWKNEVGLLALKSDDVSLVSSLIGENKRAQVSLADVTKYFGEFNAYGGDVVGVVRNEQAADLTA